jgi:hypothetical protein
MGAMGLNHVPVSFHKGKERRDRVEVNPEQDRCQPNRCVLNSVKTGFGEIDEKHS